MGELLNILRRLRIAGVAFASVLLIGTFGFYRIGGQDTAFADAFYMTGITMSIIV